MTKKKRLLSVLSIAAASIMLAASLSACGGASGSSGTSSSASGEAAKGSYSSLDDGKTAAKKCLSEYDSGKNAAVFAFANGAYSKANDAAGKVNADTSAEDVEKAASELGLERLDITDDKGTVVLLQHAIPRATRTRASRRSRISPSSTRLSRAFPTST